MPKSHLMFSRIIPTDFRWMFFRKPVLKSMLTNPTVALSGLWRIIYVFVKSRLKLPFIVTVAFVSVDFETRNKVCKNIPIEHTTIGMTQTSISTKQNSEEYIIILVSQAMLFESHYETSLWQQLYLKISSFINTILVMVGSI